MTAERSQQSTGGFKLSIAYFETQWSLTFLAKAGYPTSGQETSVPNRESPQRLP